jgi:hypothetical protein
MTFAVAEQDVATVEFWQWTLSAWIRISPSRKVFLASRTFVRTLTSVCFELVRNNGMKCNNDHTRSFVSLNVFL